MEDGRRRPPRSKAGSRRRRRKGGASLNLPSKSRSNSSRSIFASLPCGCKTRRLAIWAALFLAGCCSLEKPGKYFPRHDPLNTLCGFLYAVDTGEWDFAYDCLSLSSRQAISYTKFKLAIRFGSDQRTGQSLWQLIQETGKTAVEELTEPRYNLSRSEARMDFDLEGVDDQGKPILSSFFLHFVLESPGEEKPRWRLDLERTIREQAGQPADLSLNIGPQKFR